MKATKTVFVCTECEYKSPKWLGKCPSCGSWNSFEELEEAAEEKTAAAKRTSAKYLPQSRGEAKKFSDIGELDYERTQTGCSELDRVLGGGLVVGSVVLISGEPGIGKSTLLLQISDMISKNKKVLYISGEESMGQLKLRSQRLGTAGDNLYVLTETDIDRIMDEWKRIAPDIVIVDSVQTVYNRDVASAPGSVTQVKEAALAFISKAKNDGTAVILVGHINKEGGISGPKLLEHMVDAVLTFEGERLQSYRIIRAIKNRYGSTNEIGVFEMTDKGLLEVPNPSEMLMADRPIGTSGSCAVCVVEGTRPLIAEIQALVTPTSFAAPRRMSNGIDYNRMCLLLAVLEKKLGLKFSANDVYLNVTGGLHLDEPAADLAIAFALVSSITDKVINEKTIAFGEIGLSGECRTITQTDNRIKEAARLGFETIVLPKRSLAASKLKADGVKKNGIKSVYDLPLMFGKSSGN